MIIDFQHHYIPPALAERYGARRGDKLVLMEGGRPKFTMHDRVYDLEQQIQDMAVAGMDLAVLSCPLGWDAPLEDCQRINDEYAKVQQTHGKYFVGLANVAVHEGKPALRELERAILQLGLRGVTIMAQIQGAPLDAPAFRDFFAQAAALDIPIFVHPALMPQGYAHAEDYDLARIIGREPDLALAATRVIAGGVLEAFPLLKLVIAHFGGGIAAIKERLNNKAYRFGTRLSRSFEEYFDLLYFDMAGFEGGEAALQCALTGIKPQRLVFATDYPQDFTGVLTNTGKGLPQIRDYAAAIRKLNLPADTKEDMLGGTAARLLRLVPAVRPGLPGKLEPASPRPSTLSQSISALDTRCKAVHSSSTYEVSDRHWTTGSPTCLGAAPLHSLANTLASRVLPPLCRGFSPGPRRLAS